MNEEFHEDTGGSYIVLCCDGRYHKYRVGNQADHSCYKSTTKDLERFCVNCNKIIKVAQLHHLITYKHLDKPECLFISVAEIESKPNGESQVLFVGRKSDCIVKIKVDTHSSNASTTLSTTSMTSS